MKRQCYVAIDFDGTCVTHEYPAVGKDIGADVWLRAANKLGAKLILYTMRSGEDLERALDWFDGHEIQIWEVNANPSQAGWTSSPKVFAHFYVDDEAVGVPLRSMGPRVRSALDWELVGPELLRKIAGILNQ